eukprot:TRINITY_DN2436_c3_g1_i1.p1 TRINITY_DN2436_c3_g1~~TRINITY_DN2436_c3_g1_i1.p1  ORF type:complete len:258 (+),score=35.46 TRINITY_DN2436_c3_g1_i1:28-801(+)
MASETDMSKVDDSSTDDDETLTCGGSDDMTRPLCVSCSRRGGGITLLVCECCGVAIHSYCTRSPHKIGGLSATQRWRCRKCLSKYLTEKNMVGEEHPVSEVRRLPQFTKYRKFIQTDTGNANEKKPPKKTHLRRRKPSVPSDTDSDSDSTSSGESSSWSTAEELTGPPCISCGCKGGGSTLLVCEGCSEVAIHSFCTRAPHKIGALPPSQRWRCRKCMHQYLKSINMLHEECYVSAVRRLPGYQKFRKFDKKQTATI